MVNGIYVPYNTDEPLEVRQIEGLEDYQTAVGGWIEAVDVPDLGITVYVNEEGLLRHLPFNARASFLWWYHVPAARQAMLVGDAIIVGLPDRDDNSTDVPQRVVDLLTDDGEYVVLVKVGGSPEPSAGSRLSSILLPIVHGDPNWCISCTRFDGYLSAAAWALVWLERWTDAIETEVVRVTDLEYHLRNVVDALRE